MFFVGGSEGLITACTGMEHAQTPPWATCTNITAVRNAYPPCWQRPSTLVP
eukprot:m.229186 g.229186  ORF g.229186 m.229186 type:complete len:51 (+) comp25994_c1_seq1:321-473(+)